MKAVTIALAVALHAAAATAAAREYAVRGEVRAANGAAIENAVVELRTGDGVPLASVRTGMRGTFEFRHLEPDEYRVAASAAGFAPGEARAPRDLFGEWVQVVLAPIAGRPPAPSPGARRTLFAQAVPEAARTAYRRGVARLRAGRSEDGVRLLREAIARFDAYFDAHVLLGAQLYGSGRYEEAREALESARRINDGDGGVHEALGLVLKKQRRFEAAAAAFRDAAGRSPAAARPRFCLAQALIEIAGRRAPDRREALLTEAEAELGRAWELSGGRLAAVHVERARIHERRGDWEAAAREVEAFLKEQPDAGNATALRAAIEKLRAARKD